MLKSVPSRVQVTSAAFAIRFLPASLTAAALLAAIVAILYVHDRRHQQVILEQDSRHLVQVQSEFLAGSLRDVQVDVLYLSDQQVLHRFLTRPESSRAELEHEYARFCLRKAVYDQVRCLDSEGREVIRINFRGGRSEVVPAEQLQSKAQRYYFRDAQTLARGEVRVSPFDLNIERDQIEQPLVPVIRFVTPVFDQRGSKRAYVVLNYSGAHLLARLSELSARSSGHSMLVNDQGEYLRARNSDDAWGWMLGHDRSFKKHFPVAWERIGRSQSGQFFTDDGLFTYQQVLPSVRPAAADDAEQPSPMPGRADSAVESNRLIVISYVPANTLAARSDNLLRQLSLMFGVAVLPVLILSAYWAYAGAAREEQARQIADSESRLRSLSKQLLEGQEQERRSISRDLHDELGQQATAVHLDLRSIERDPLSERTKTLLQRASDGVQNLLKSLHEMASRVRPSVLDDLGLRDAVDSFVAAYEERTGIKVDADLQFETEDIPRLVGENAYRIMQEALTNIAKHAKAATASLTVVVDPSRLQITVRDDGVGFDMSRRDAARLGILGMQERAELLVGTFAIHTQPGAGTRIEVTLPMRDWDSTTQIVRRNWERT